MFISVASFYEDVTKKKNSRKASLTDLSCVYVYLYLKLTQEMSVRLAFLALSGVSLMKLALLFALNTV